MTSFARILRALTGFGGLSVKAARKEIKNKGGNSSYNAGLARQARIAKKPFERVVHTPADYCDAARKAHIKRLRKRAARLSGLPS